VPTNWWNAIDAQSRPFVKLEDNLTAADPKFADERNGNFQLTDASPAWATGFQRIPVEKIGLTAGDDRASWPVTHSPLPLPPPQK